MPSTSRYKVRLNQISTIQLGCPNPPSPKNPRISHFLTITGNQFTNLVVTDATIFGFATTFTWLAFGDVPFTFFREQEISLVHFNDTLESLGWNLLQSGKDFMSPVEQGNMRNLFVQYFSTLTKGVTAGL